MQNNDMCFRENNNGGRLRGNLHFWNGTKKKIFDGFFFSIFWE